MHDTVQSMHIFANNLCCTPGRSISWRSCVPANMRLSCSAGRLPDGELISNVMVTRSTKLIAISVICTRTGIGGTNGFCFM
jgi:hypothetical protein